MKRVLTLVLLISSFAAGVAQALPFEVKETPISVQTQYNP